MADTDTDLVISGIGVPIYSARGITQTLQPIDAAKNFDRTINGAFKNLAGSQFQKYRSTIRGKDVNPPALDGCFPGFLLTIDCVEELSYLTAGGSPNRTVVPGSSRTDGDHTFYRPRLSFALVDFETSKTEWEALVDWRLDVEEI